MIKNNKGFMLIEVVITSTVILSTMVGLYVGYNKLYKNYVSRNNYYNIDATYATNNIINSIFENNTNEFLYNVFYNANFKYIIKDGICNEELTTNIDMNICNRVKDYYKVKNMIIVEYAKPSVEEIKETNNINYTFEEYMDYVIKYYGLSTEEDYDYLFLTEINDGDNYYYANMRVR